jgi:glycosyltransferase involved in cell wall biosynthesis
MKALMVLDQEFPPDIRVENEIEALTAAGIEIHLACYTRKGKPAVEKQGLWVIHRKPISSLVYKSSVAALRVPLYFNFWRRFLQSILDQEPVNLIHVHDLPLVGVGKELGNTYHIPVIADLHENWPAYLRISSHTRTLAGRILSPIRPWEKFEKELLGTVQEIIVVVEEAQNRLEAMGISRKNIHIVSNTLNLAHFRIGEGEPDRQEIILFYAGGLTFHRGLQTVIRAIGLVKNERPSLRFWILGDGSYRKSLEKLTSQLGLEEQVIFFGHKPYQEMTGLLGKTQYTIIPHLKSAHTDATIPHKIFQYMYAGKPVISTDCLPLARVIEEAACGYIYPSTDAEKLAQILRSLNTEKDGELGKNGKQAVIDKYSWDKDASVLCTIYKTINNE